MYLSISVGAVLCMAFGFLWYGPLFGTIWKTATGITPEIEAGMKATMARKYSVNFAGQVVTGFVIYTLFRMTGVTTALGSIELVTLVWFGCILPLEVSGAVWAKNPSWSLFYLHNGHTLMTYFIMALSIIFIGK